MTTKIKGELEIDHERGVIYFHTSDKKAITEFDGNITILRICSLPNPIPKRHLDITHMRGANWHKFSCSTCNTEMVKIPTSKIENDSYWCPNCKHTNGKEEKQTQASPIVD